MPVMDMWRRWPRWVFVVYWAWTWWRPLWPLEQAMHNSLTVVAVLVLWRWGPRWRLTRLDEGLILLFLALHSLAAHWLYSNVPYDAWTRAWLGVSLNEWMGWRRNHFDRLVHFMYGVCFTPALFSIALARLTPSVGLARVLAVGAIIVSGVVYEWLEWGVALALSPEAAESYNGQQGDVWDPHMDMLLAAIGALITWPWLRPASPRTPQAS